MWSKTTPIIQIYVKFTIKIKIFGSIHKILQRAPCGFLLARQSKKPIKCRQLVITAQQGSLYILLRSPSIFQLENA